MAEVGSQEWIDASLAKLEELESARDALANSEDGDLNEIARLDAEIAELYASLEAVAHDEPEPEPEPEPAPVAAAAPEPEPEPEPEHEPELEDNPFGAAPAAAHAVAAAATGDGLGGLGQDNSWAEGYADDDFKPKGGAGKWIVLALVLVGGGVGGFMWWQGQEKAKAEQEAAASAPAAAPTVIEAVAVPEDTEDLKTAKGQDVDRIPGTEFEKKKRSGGGGGSRSGGSRPSTTTKKRGDGRSIDLSGSDDPLG